MPRSVRFVPAALAVALVFACAPRPDAPRAAADSPVAAEIRGQPVTVAELDEWIKEQLFRQATREGDPAKLYELRKRGIEELIHRRLLEEEAKRRGADAEAVLNEEVGRRSTPTPQEVEEFYERHKQQFAEASPEDARARIQESLQRQKQRSAVDTYLGELREQAQVAVHLEPPRNPVAATGPARGPENAPVTIVEFSDYQCPFCERAEPVVAQILERYPEQVRFVYRHFPLDSIHPRARPAAEAAACADAQGRFWDYHEKVFKNAKSLTDEDLLRYAGDLKLDTDAFRTCVEERRFREAVESDIQAGRTAGVSGTPTFFVNGIALSGARPLEDFVEIIEAELEREPAGS